MKTTILLLLAALVLCNAVRVKAVEASIKNRLGIGNNMTLHCRSKDDDLGIQTLSYDDAFTWEFGVNPWGTTLFYCRLGWQSVDSYEFDAYSFRRDSVRCDTRCLWLVSQEGIYGLDSQTGLWNFFYHW